MTNNAIGNIGCGGTDLEHMPSPPLISYIPPISENLFPEYALPSLPLTYETLALLDRSSASIPPYLCDGKSVTSSTHNSPGGDNDILNYAANTELAIDK